MSDRDGDFEIYAMNPDGMGLTQLTNNGGTDDFPAVSADGAKIAFASTRDGNWEIYVMNADGTGQTRLTNDPATDTNPTWSPDGMKIAFLSDRDGNFEVYVMNADGTGQTRLTNDPATDGNPSWSPDGMRIAFDSTRDDPSAEIYVMNADGTGLLRLTTTVSTQDVIPTWAPDGGKILWRRDFGGCSSADLWVMNPDGTGQTPLVCATGHDGEGVFSPDGTKIAFTNARTGNAEIYVRDVLGGEGSETPVTFHPGRDISLDWGRVPVTPVEIDIKPGSDPNCINADGNGVIPVAILTTPGFDASTADPFSVALEGAAVRVKGKSGGAGALEDVDGDGDLDLVVQIDDDSVLAGKSTATLTGQTFGGTPVQGQDTICIVP